MSTARRVTEFEVDAERFADAAGGEFRVLAHYNVLGRMIDTDLSRLLRQLTAAGMTTEYITKVANESLQTTGHVYTVEEIEAWKDQR